MTAAIDLKVLAAKMAIAYYHWRTAGFPDDHEYHLYVALFDNAVNTLTDGT